MNRRTSCYTLEVKSDDPSPLVDEFIKNCPVPVFASGVMVEPKRAFIRFRARDDAEAIDISFALSEHEGTLHTGYGVNQRVAHPVG